MNPLFNALGGGQMPGMMGQFQNMMRQFQQFKQSFQGDPRVWENLAAAVEPASADGWTVSAAIGVVDCYKPAFLWVFRLIAGSVSMLSDFSYLHI